MQSTPSGPWLQGLRREARTVVVIDLVDSVRLIERHEEETVRRWRAFVDSVDAEIGEHGGRVVKSLGDGLLLEFGTVTPAMACALAMHRRIKDGNAGYADDQRLSLRIGMHVCDVIIDRRDIYGSGVNLTARIAGLARPGETVVTSAVRQQIVPGLDADVEDLGECYLKNIAAPVRAWRMHALDEAARDSWRSDTSGCAGGPLVAVLPFSVAKIESEARFIAEALTDELIAGLSKAPPFRVISRLSVAPFSGRQPGLSELRSLLGATYLVSGRAHLDASRRLWVSIELADGRDGRVLWADRLQGSVDDVFAADGELVLKILEQVARVIFRKEVELTHRREPSTLESQSLLLAAIATMHHMTQADSEHAERLLTHLIEREPRHAAAHAWLAKWHVLQIVQGWSVDRVGAASRALACVGRALDSDPESSLASAIEGLVRAYLHKDLVRAGRSYERALAANPNESLAWLFRSTLHAYRGEVAPAAHASQRALCLSPLDPLKYFYDSLAATAALAGHDFDRSITLAHRSLRQNRTHASTWRTLVYALVIAGRGAEACAAARELLDIEPGLTVSGFRERFPGRDGPMAQPWAAALEEAGVPA